jgi:tellurium resistance protein TerD
MTGDDFFAYAPGDDDAPVAGLAVERGQSVDLTARGPTLAEIMVGVGWDLKPFDANPMDVDVSAFLLGPDDRTRENDDFVFYNHMEGCGGAVVHHGDSRTGAGEGDDETISLNLRGIPFGVARVVFALTVHDGDERGQALRDVRGGFLRLVDKRNSHEIARYTLGPELEGRAEAGMLVAALERQGPNWIFHALGEPAEGGLAAIATRYGIVVAQAGRG